MLLPNRNGSAEANGYRYGFNGMEKDDELKGEGNSYDYNARFYDPRVNRFLSIDPQSRHFSYESNYVYVSNNPIIYKDPTGETKILTINYTDEATGEVTSISVVIDEDYIESRPIYGANGYYFKDIDEYSWHDVNVVQDIIVHKDGSFSYGKTTEQLMDKELTRTNYNSKGYASFKIKMKDIARPRLGEVREGGGIDFYSEKGEGGAYSPKAKNNANVDYVNGDDLIALLKMGKGMSKGLKGASNGTGPHPEVLIKDSKVLAAIKKSIAAISKFKKYKKEEQKIIEPIFEWYNEPVPCPTCGKWYTDLTQEEVHKDAITPELRKKRSKDKKQTNASKHQNARQKRNKG